MNPQLAKRNALKRHREEEKQELDKAFATRYRAHYGHLPSTLVNPDESDEDSDDEEEMFDLDGNPADNGVYKRPGRQTKKSASTTLRHGLRNEAIVYKDIPMKTVQDIQDGFALPALSRAVMQALKEEGRNANLRSEREFSSLGIALCFTVTLPKVLFNDPDDEVELQNIHCTGTFSWRKKQHSEPRNDCIAYEGIGRSERQDSHLGPDEVGQLKALFQLDLPLRPGQDRVHHGRYAAIRPMRIVPRRNKQQAVRAFTVLEWANRRDENDLLVIRIKSITRAVCLVPILPTLAKVDRIPKGSSRHYEAPAGIFASAERFILNNRVDPETFNTYYAHTTHDDIILSDKGSFSDAELDENHSDSNEDPNSS
ncbi:hypothetical protein BJ508DRAFT_335367 [Ascobolus immersus RN42]|uniref:Uncharacterized protein n=1 Tax=Ascobolus immersus RN42 TaxID=1160509 RepID=A0A3N4HIQ2_ASCIM|nr:hypothetical protein BJ508DRAFT_336175 [Ascobolus immersus RN42]RPA72101.1 hypothetical protein BJ508DRAFT_335367 [Ascobolus immersus RN42]